MQATYMQIAEVSGRHMREIQSARARFLLEMQRMEIQHSTLNFERTLKMSEDRNNMEQVHVEVRA
ncbi:MAG: hypothetical protein EOO41_03750 [Methanobacteriota archaeon]|nr:MAG: hypothetical protein EOO41_03750 [Euryarchaeota archaeon]